MLNGSSDYSASTLVSAMTTGSINASGSGGTAGLVVFARTTEVVLVAVCAGGRGK